MTSQIFETLIIDDSPLSIPPCFTLPKKHQDISEAAVVDKGLASLESMTQTTMCWRRYVGTWEIIKGKLYLRELVGGYKLNVRGGVFAEWYSGTITIPVISGAPPVIMKIATPSKGEFQIEVERGFVIEPEPGNLEQEDILDILHPTGKTIYDFDYVTAHESEFLSDVMRKRLNCIIDSLNDIFGANVEDEYKLQFLQGITDLVKDDNFNFPQGSTELYSDLIFENIQCYVLLARCPNIDFFSKALDDVSKRKSFALLISKLMGKEAD